MKGMSASMPKEPPPTVHFSFRKGDKPPKGFDELSVGKEVSVTVKGKVASVNQDSYGSGFSLENFTLSFPKPPNLRRFG